MDVRNITEEDLLQKNIILTSVDALFDWARSRSLFVLTMGLACCAIEMMCSAGPRFDLARFGSEIFRPSPRQADLMIVAGTITRKMQPVVKRLYEQMPEPKYVLVIGSCAIGGGPFRDSYNVIPGADTFLPVDVYVPGCPPRPEGLINGFLQLRQKAQNPRKWALGMVKKNA